MTQDAAERLAATIGGNIRRELIRIGQTHEWLAGRINRERATVGFYVNGQRLPPVDVLERISRVLRPEQGGSVDWLMGLEGRELRSDERELLADYQRIQHPVYKRMARDAVRALGAADRELAESAASPA
jgi:transcriptional regulator with XRE-family HTH domain